MLRIEEIDLSPDFTSSADIIKCIHYSMTPGRVNFSTASAWPQGLNFLIGSWQSGDFPHLYAAVASELTSSQSTRLCTILVLQAEGFSLRMLSKDWEAALKGIVSAYNRDVCIYFTSARSKSKMVDVLGQLFKVPLAAFKSPAEATTLSSGVVQGMTPGRTLVQGWEDITRSPESPEHINYAAAATAFAGAFYNKQHFTSIPDIRNAQLICIWGRTSGMRIAPSDTNAGRPLGGANPQYDSSLFGNEQLVKMIGKHIPEIDAVLTVGDGFNAKTLNLPYVFNLGEFWRELGDTSGRFKENGFFDFLIATYNFNIVHVGMKSGGMDMLGLWGQKVVFVEYEKVPEIVKGRVESWHSPNLTPVYIDQLPTATGKVIQALRQKHGDAHIKTSLEKKHWREVDAEEKTGNYKDGFLEIDLLRIVSQVKAMLTGNCPAPMPAIKKS